MSAEVTKKRLPTREEEEGSGGVGRGRGIRAGATHGWHCGGGCRGVWRRSMVGGVIYTHEVCTVCTNSERMGVCAQQSRERGRSKLAALFLPPLPLPPPALIASDGLRLFAVVWPRRVTLPSGRTQFNQSPQLGPVNTHSS